MQNRWRNYGLWSAVLAFIPLLLSAFDINIAGSYQELANGVLAILVLAGIINDPTTFTKGFKDDDSTDK